MNFGSQNIGNFLKINLDKKKIISRYFFSFFFNLLCVCVGLVFNGSALLSASMGRKRRLWRRSETGGTRRSGPWTPPPDLSDRRGPPSSLVRTRSMWSEMFFNKNYYLNYFGRQNEWKICQVAMNGVVRPRESLAKSIWIQRSNKLKQTNWEISLLLSFIFYLWINSSLWRE